MELQNRIQVFDEKTEDSYSIINKIVDSGHQKEGFFVCNVSEIVSRYQKWQKIFPNVKMFYDVKCNDSKVVLTTMAALDSGFSCVSKEEIRKLISIGVAPNKIIFSSPTKKISHVKYAAQVGVQFVVFDNNDELYKIKNNHPSAELILRISIPESTENLKFNRKYGVLPNSDAQHLLWTAKSLDLNVVGLVFHLDSCLDRINEYSKAIEQIKKVSDMAANLGYSLKIIDVGGGCLNVEDDIENVAQVINDSLARNFPEKDIQFIAEPGAYCVESAFKLISRIHSKRTVAENIRMYYLDLGIYTGLAPIIFKKYFVCKPLKATSTRLFDTILWGPTCDCTDKLSKDIDHLPDMNIDDWVIFEDTGAYTLPLTYEFNGYTIPNLHSIITTETWCMLTEKVPNPIPKSNFVVGESLDNYHTGLNIPHVFHSQYY